MKGKNQMETARTIINQIKGQDPFALMAWGVTKIIGLHQYKHFSGGVTFNVNGLKCKKATVHIWHNEASDLYEISLVKGTKVVEKVDDVYFDQLITVLDHLIEGKDGKDLTMEEAWTGK